MLELTFGKHKGKTVEQVFWVDPGYCWWMARKEFHKASSQSKFTAEQRERLRKLFVRARHVIIPGNCTWCNERPVTRMFLTQHISGGLARVDFDCDVCEYGGGSTSIPMKPGFFTPDIYRGYDKTGGKFLVEALKYAFFDDKSYRMTKKRADDFFNDRSNFVRFE